MKNGYDHHVHQDIYTYNLSVPKRFTLDVPNQSPPKFKALSPPVSDINLAFLVALGLESKSENGVLQQQVLLCLVFQVLPDISHCEVPHIFNEAKLNIYQWTNSIISNLNSFLPPILHICHRNSLTKLILITQLNQLAVTHSTHPNHPTH